MTTPAPATDVFAAVSGQDAAVRMLRAAVARPVHAYLFVGPEGTGKRAAAAGFAAALLCQSGGCGACDLCRRVLAGAHPDVVVVERQGASITASQVDEIIRLAARSPVEGARKVLVLVDFHLVAQQYPRLLKTIEEPPPSAVFLVLAEHLPAELATISSRCVRVDFGPVPADAIVAVLVGEGVDEHTARDVATAAGGRLDRARLLASDDGFAARVALWRDVPARLDGTGSTAAALADELLAAVEGVTAPLEARHTAEAAEAQERADRYGERINTRDLVERQRREQRRVRIDELRFGLATLAGAYRDRLRDSRSPHDGRAVDLIQGAGEALIRNPNEQLLLQGLLVRLTGLAMQTPVGSR